MVPESQPINDNAISGCHLKLPAEGKSSEPGNERSPSTGWVHANGAGLSR